MYVSFMGAVVYMFMIFFKYDHKKINKRDF